MHFDLDPRNIMMGSGNDENKLFIMDYGLAKKIHDKQGKHLKYK